MKSDNSRIVLKSSIWYTISNFLTRAMVFITTPIFTRLLTTEQFGNFNVFANWQSSFVIICGFEVYVTVNRARFDFKEKEALDSYIISCLALSSIITGTILGLYLFFPTIFEDVLLMDREYIFIMFVYLFAYPSVEMFQIKQRINYNYKLSASISFGSVMICTVLALLLSYYNDSDRLFGRVIGQYMPVALLGFILYIYFLKCSHDIKVSNWKYAVKFAIPFVFSYLGSQILLSSDKIIVQHISSSEAVAYLGIATSCSHIMIIFINCLNNAWSPWFYDRLNNQEYSKISKTYGYYSLFIVLCTLCVLLIGPELVFLLGGERYRNAVAILPPNIVVGFLTMMVTQFGAFETFYKKPEYAAILTAITAVINIVLDIVCVKIWGYIAASYVTVFCYILLIFMHAIVSKKLGAQKVFSMRLITSSICISMILIVFSLFLYQSTRVRYAVIGIIGVLFCAIMWLKRKFIIEFIWDLKKV